MFEFDYSADEPVAVVSIPADEVTSGDTIPSHDGREHYVEGVCVSGHIVTINVCPSSGESYSVELQADSMIRVLA